MFNSTINGIEDADLILLLGANPRYEATILNARIRKSYLNNSTRIVSLNDCGDLTYPYESLDGQTKTIKEIIDGAHILSKEIESAKKPMIIIGESLLRLEDAKYLFDNFLPVNNSLKSSSLFKATILIFICLIKG